MFARSLALSFRSLFQKNRLFTLINVGGLAVAFACFFLVSVFVYDEHIFDRYHKNADRIFRIVLDFSSDGVVTNWAKTSAPIGEYLPGTYPEIEQLVRIRKNPGTDLLGIEDAKHYAENIFFADSTLFEVFDFKMIRGNAEIALDGKNNIVLTKRLSYKLFGHLDILGKSIKYNNEVDLKVTGVIEDMPKTSHFISDAFITFSSLGDILGEKRLTHWGQFDHYTYVLLSNGSFRQNLELKFSAFLMKNAPEWVSEKETLSLQPLNSIHLHSNRKDEITPNSNERYSYILGTIAAFIVLMASANFINLATATQIARQKEIAIRKVLGASSNNVIIYFWSEAFVICSLSLLVSLFLGYIALPSFNLLTNKAITLSSIYWPIILTTVLAFLIALISGLLPAIYAYKFKSSNISGRNLKIGRKPFRLVLVTFQFFVSIFLIVATVVVSNQVEFLKSSQLGFDASDVIVIPIKDRSGNDKYRTINTEIEKITGVEQASFCSSSPGTNNSLTYTYSFTGTEVNDQAIPTFIVDENFQEIYNISLIRGKFVNQQVGDTLTQVVLNEEAVRQFGLKDPIGQRVTGKVMGVVVGVIEDFNHSTLHGAFQPVIMYSFVPTFRFVSVKLERNRIREAIAGLESRWQDWFAGFPMEYAFVADQNNALYESERVLSNLYLSFSWIAILIAAIGLIGLTSYQLERKKKQISIRKVLGGSSVQMLQLIYSNYVPVVIVSAVSAWAVAYYWMERWLSEFSNRIDLRLQDFIVPTMLMIITLLISTGVQSLHASMKNPVDNLREE
ncbi:MAG: ABC transporter permease [Cyclobacteriaceae bacterium]